MSLVAAFAILIVDVSRNGTLNMTPAERERHQQSVLYVMKYRVFIKFYLKQLFYSAAEVLEREKLLSAGVATSVTPHDLLQPNSDFHIRNRYLSRIGAPVNIGV